MLHLKKKKKKRKANMQPRPCKRCNTRGSRHQGIIGKVDFMERRCAIGRKMCPCLWAPVARSFNGTGLRKRCPAIHPPRTEDAWLEVVPSFARTGVLLSTNRKKADMGFCQQRVRLWEGSPAPLSLSGCFRGRGCVNRCDQVTQA